MNTLCLMAISLAVGALGLASYPYLHAVWEHHSRRARLHRRIQMARLL